MNQTLTYKRTSPAFSLSFDELGPIIEQYFKVRVLNDSAIPITEFTKRLIRENLIDKIDQGQDFDTAVKNFKELAVTWTGRGGRSFNRARRIIQTETTKAMSFGGLIGAYMTGIDLDKVWVTSEDERVRGLPNYKAPFPHVDLDLNTAALMGSFYNGERIRFPGDPDASLENIANCRCSMYFKEKGKDSERARREGSGHRLRQSKVSSWFFPKILKALKDQLNSFFTAITSNGYEWAKAQINNIVTFSGIAKVLKLLYLKSAYIEANHVLRTTKGKKVFQRNLLAFLGAFLTGRFAAELV